MPKFETKYSLFLSNTYEEFTTEDAASDLKCVLEE